MRRDKTVARIILLFFIANVVLAAPALVRQTRLVTDRADDTGSVYQNEMVPAAPPSGRGSEHGTSPESKRDSSSQLGLSRRLNGPVLQDLVVPPLTPAGSEKDRMLEYSDDGLSDGASVRQSYAYAFPPSDYEWSEQHSPLHSVSGSSDLSFAKPNSGLPPPELSVSEGKAPLLHDGLPDSPSELQHSGSHPSAWEAGGPSNSAGESSSQTVGKLSQTVEEPSHMVPDAPEAQTLHDEKTQWWHDLYFHADADDDQSSLKSWQSWGSEEGAKIADISHFHPY